MKLTLRVWRQDGPDAPGRFETYEAPDVKEEMSFLEMLDVVNERLIEAGREPITFDSDCREGICGTCGVMIDGKAHGPWKGTATCQLHMRAFRDGDVITIEPWRAAAFPVIKDLMVDRSALDAIIEAGGYISVNTGAAPEANEIPVPKPANTMVSPARTLAARNAATCELSMSRATSSSSRRNGTPVNLRMLTITWPPRLRSPCTMWRRAPSSSWASWSPSAGSSLR